MSFHLQMIFDKTRKGLSRLSSMALLAEPIRKPIGQLERKELYMLVRNACVDFFTKKQKRRYSNEQYIERRIHVVYEMAKGYYSISCGVSQLVKLDKVMYSDEEALDIYKRRLYYELRNICRMVGIN